MASVLVRCKKCRRPFATSADVCPDCGQRSPRGARNYVIKVVSVILAAMALTATLILAVNHMRTLDPKEDSHAALPALSPPQSQAGNEISFTSQ